MGDRHNLETVRQVLQHNNFCSFFAQVRIFTLLESPEKYKDSLVHFLPHILMSKISVP